MRAKTEKEPWEDLFSSEEMRGAVVRKLRDKFVLCGSLKELLSDVWGK